jgi:SAM-dependent methyltransferase
MRYADYRRAAELPQADASTLVDRRELERQVKAVYRGVARDPFAARHFETGRNLALRLGYPESLLASIPYAALASFAGVGYHLDLADLRAGDRVLDLGSGSGMDAFCAGASVGATGRVIGVDFTDAQVANATRLAERHRVENVRFVEASIDRLPFDDGSFDVVISNGVINLSPVKQRVFAEAARVLRPGGRLANRGHRQRDAAQGEDQTQHRTLGSLHRRRDPVDRVPGRALRSGLRDRGDPAQRVPVPQRPGPRCVPDLRRREREHRREERRCRVDLRADLLHRLFAWLVAPGVERLALANQQRHK